jgi:hypothetical protein
MSGTSLRVGAIGAALMGMLLAGTTAVEAEDSDSAVSASGNRGASSNFDDTSENVYRVINPCRLVDTRHGGGGLISGGQTRTYTAIVGLSAQGGNAADTCGVPATAVGISANVTITKTTGSGHLRTYPAGAQLPNASTINWSESGRDDANEVTIRLGTGGNAGKFNVFAAGGSTHVVIDVTGFQVQSISAMVTGVGDLFYNSRRVISATKVGTGDYTVKLDRPPFDGVNRACTPIAALLAGAGEISVNTAASDVTVKTFNAAGTASDRSFWLHVDC